MQSLTDRLKYQDNIRRFFRIETRIFAICSLCAVEITGALPQTGLIELVGDAIQKGWGIINDNLYCEKCITEDFQGRADHDSQ